MFILSHLVQQRAVSTAQDLNPESGTSESKMSETKWKSSISPSSISLVKNEMKPRVFASFETEPQEPSRHARPNVRPHIGHGQGNVTESLIDVRQAK